MNRETIIELFKSINELPEKNILRSVFTNKELSLDFSKMDDYELTDRYCEFSKTSLNNILRLGNSLSEQIMELITSYDSRAGSLATDQDVYIDQFGEVVFVDTKCDVVENKNENEDAIITYRLIRTPETESLFLIISGGMICSYLGEISDVDEYLKAYAYINSEIRDTIMDTLCGVLEEKFKIV